jgi:predicted transcriptional regulator
MSRPPSLAAMLLLLSMGVLALCGSAQTPPPETGDWVVGNTTQLSGGNVTVDGSVVVRDGGWLILSDLELECHNISVLGGTLELLRTDVVLAGPGPSSLNASGGSYSVSGGSMTCRGQEAIVILAPGCTINGTAISGMETVLVSGWGSALRDCTVEGSTGNGVTVYALNMPQDTLEVTGNRVTGAGLSGIYVNQVGYSGSTVVMRISGNEVVDPGGSGIYMLTGYLDGVQVDLSGNRVTGAVNHGLFAALSGNALVADLGGSWADGAGMDGVRVVLDAVSVASLGLRGIHAVNNTGFGLSVFSLNRQTTGLLIEDLNASDNGEGGLLLSGCTDAELTDSTVLNPGASSGDYRMEHSSLFVRNTVHRRAVAAVTGPVSSVVSLRRLELTVVWQDGRPVAYRRVSLVDDGSAVVLSQITDGGGRLGVNFVWDWKVDALGTQVRTTFQPVMTGDGWAVRGDVLPLDVDRKGVLVLVDDIPPVLVVVRPRANDALSSSTLEVEGTCEDPQTSVALVQVSIDDEPDWDAKTWHDAPGVATWKYSFSGLPDGTYDIYVRAFDVPNHPEGAYSGVVVRDVTVDTVPPWLVVDSPTEGTLTNSVRLEVRGRVEGGSTVTVDGLAAEVSGDTFVAAVLLAEGVNDLGTVATDAAGNSETVVRRVRLDTVPPPLAIDGVGDGRLWLPVDGREVGGRAEPGARVTLQVGTSTTAVELDPDGRFAIWMTPMEDGAAVVFEAVDPAGNVARVELMVDLGDEVPPVLVIDRPATDAVLNTSSVEVAGRCHDPQGVALVQVSLDEVPDWDAKVWHDAVGTVDWRYIFVGLADGTHNVYVRAFDAWNPSTGTYSRAVVGNVTVDTVAPWLNVIAPADGALTNWPVISVRGTVSHGAAVTVQGVVVDVAGGTFSVDLRLVEGENEVLVLARDRAGNVNRLSRTVLVDTVPPFLELYDVREGRLLMHTEGHEVVGRTEPGARVSFLLRGSVTEVSVDDDGTFTHWIPSLQEGAKVTIEAVDAAGNTVKVVFRVELPAGGPSGPSGPSPAAVGATMLTTLVVLGVILSVESFRYTILVALIPLYARVRKEKVLDNRARYLLHGIIIDNPGIHYRALLREFGLSNGITTYHLDVLEREGFVRSVRDGRLRRFYSVNVKVPQDRKLTPKQLSSRISSLVAGRPGISQKQVIEELGLPRRTVGYHLRELVSSGELHASRKGRNTVYRIRPRERRTDRVKGVRASGAQKLRSEGRAETVEK